MIDDNLFDMRGAKIFVQRTHKNVFLKRHIFLYHIKYGNLSADIFVHNSLSAKSAIG